MSWVYKGEPALHLCHRHFRCHLYLPNGGKKRFAAYFQAAKMKIARSTVWWPRVRKWGPLPCLLSSSMYYQCLSVISSQGLGVVGGKVAILCSVKYVFLFCWLFWFYGILSAEGFCRIWWICAKWGRRRPGCRGAILGRGICHPLN